MSGRLKIGLLALGLLSVAGPAIGQELRIGTAGNPTSLDPQFTNAAPNIALARQVFDGLINYGPNLELDLALATDVTQVDPLTWRIGLREGVVFHDGSAFTSADVVCSLTRALEMPNSPSSFASTLRGKQWRADGDNAILITTETPTPLIRDDLAPVTIVSDETGCSATTADFNSGDPRIIVGTGPFRFVERTNEKITLARNNAYWRGPAAWQSVTILPITEAGSRVLALTAGDVDLIDSVPNINSELLKSDPRFSVFQGPTTRIVHIQLDQFRESSPFVTDRDGRPIPNPLRDPRVRLALSLAINRDLLNRVIMEGNAVPSGQLQPTGIFGNVEGLEPVAFDPARARALLAEAGYPNGFRLTLHGPSDRYQNDAAIVQTVASMWSQIGVVTVPDVMPFSVYNPRQADGGDGQPAFSASLSGVASLSSGGLSLLRLLVASFDPPRGFGNFNRGRYSSAEIDALVAEALQTVDAAAREEITRRATELAMEDVAIIPIHFQTATWAARNDILFTPQVSEFTLAAAARPASSP